MTPQELELERQYLIDERLGIMCGNNEPTVEQIRLAVEYAQQEIEKMQQ